MACTIYLGMTCMYYYYLGMTCAVQLNCFRRHCGRVVSASDSQSVDPGFESRSVDLLDLLSVVPSSNPRPRL